MDTPSLYGLPAPGGLLGAFGAGGTTGTQANSLLAAGQPRYLPSSGGGAPSYGYGGNQRAQIPADALAYLQKMLGYMPAGLASPFNPASSNGTGGAAAGTGGSYGGAGTNPWLGLLNNLGGSY